MSINNIHEKIKGKDLITQKKEKTFDESHGCGVYATKGQELVFITTCIYSCCAPLSHNIQNASNFRFRYTTSPTHLYEDL